MLISNLEVESLNGDKGKSLNKEEFKDEIEYWKTHMVVFKKKFLQMSEAKNAFAKSFANDEKIVMGVSNDFNDISELVDSTIQNVKKLKEDKNIPAIQQNLNESQVKEQPNSKSSFFVYLNLPFILLANFFLLIIYLI